jgi:general secretion pathway protein D
MPFGTRLHLIAACASLGAILSGCTPTPHLLGGIENDIPEPLIAHHADDDVSENVSESEAADAVPGAARVRTLPSMPAMAAEPPADLTRETVIDGVSTVSWPQDLPSFLDVVFGEVLELPFSYGADVAEREELVNFSVARPVSQSELLDSVRLVLRDYGLAVIEQDGVYRIVESEQFWRAAPSFVVSRSSRDTPADLRPVVQVVPLRSMDANSAVSFIESSFEGDEDISISAAPRDNTVIVRGLPSQVRNAVSMLSSLDQPRFADAIIRSFSPRFWSSEELSRAMSEALQAEGLQVSLMATARRPITLIDVPTSNEILIFAESSDLANRALFWASHLDASAEIGDEPQIFVYLVENTDASNVAEVVNAVFSGGAGPSRDSSRDDASAAGGSGESAQTRTVSGRGRLVVDPFTNQILFEGVASDWERLLPLFRRLDRQTPEVLIEVIVAEITLSNDTNSGVEWLLEAADVGSNDTISGSTLGGLGLQSGGLTVNLRGSNARAVISALNESNRVRLLATPRLAARSGGLARINVGTEVPVIISQAASDVQQSNGGTEILQSVEYRQTGNILTIEPIVYGAGRVDLNVSLEVSEAQSNPNQSIPSPVILNRSVETQLSLEDGAAAVIGGIIQQSQTNGSTGVPGLQSIPGIGRAFRADTIENSRTELLLIIRPYLVNDPTDRAELVEVLRQSMEDAVGDDTLR